MHQDLKDSLAFIPEEITNAFYPKAFSELPPGYASPKYLPVFAEIITSGALKDRNDKYRTELVSMWKVASQGVPTFFAKDDFLRAIIKSHPPEETKLTDLKWPFDAMLIVLSESFSMEYFGRKTAWIVMHKTGADERIPGPGPLPAFPSFSEAAITMLLMMPVGPMLHTSHVLHKIEGTTVKDVIEIPLDAQGNEQPGDENEKLMLLGFNILLAMSAVPEFIYYGCEKRKAMEKKGKVRKALWEPNWIGKSFVLRRESFEHGGTHASPMMHWRMGHWRHQAIGPCRSERKLIWIQPVLVNGKDSAENKPD